MVFVTTIFIMRIQKEATVICCICNPQNHAFGSCLLITHFEQKSNIPQLTHQWCTSEIVSSVNILCTREWDEERSRNVLLCVAKWCINRVEKTNVCIVSLFVYSISSTNKVPSHKLHCHLFHSRVWGHYHIQSSIMEMFFSVWCDESTSEYHQHSPWLTKAIHCSILPLIYKYPNIFGFGNVWTWCNCRIFVDQHRPAVPKWYHCGIVKGVACTCIQ